AGAAGAGFEPREGARRPRLPWGRRPSTARPDRLAELENAVEFAQHTAFDLHFRLRPALVAIAAQRLAGRGLDLETRPERCRQILGEEAWEILRPDRPAPMSRTARGIEPAALERVVKGLGEL
ncbi:MAG: hypothetical protein M3024_06410, partial [Candidatus Dormibacteraeota bacterium]|nr:hypothetical protein [Candidatus Dormibacteraeota bacterium]